MPQYQEFDPQTRKAELERLLQSFNTDEQSLTIRARDEALNQMMEENPGVARQMIEDELQQIEMKERKSTPLLPLPLPFNMLQFAGICGILAVAVLVLPLLFGAGLWVNQFMIALIGLPVLAALLWISGIIDFEPFSHDGDEPE